ncbi:MAG: 30S ribosomal protein S4 [Candidatus Levybacteria bacterium RIFCSPLOWO2_01_FULL_39_10]|nr:MAG: 30S ribosomal protein S4 [Candidatus Levybacteria bacterium RIFCSPLOWO2_01_FULL_39_10]
MARQTGPKHKIARREGVNVLDKSSASLTRRLNIPPGQHGRKRKKRLSEYGTQLREKQKAKATYGLLEKQFKKIFKYVESQKAETGELLIALLETRLDNLVYRIGFSQSRAGARQLVSHGHVKVNGQKVNIPSYQVKVNDVITIDDKTQKNPLVLQAMNDRKDVLGFIEREGASGKLVRFPKKDDLEVPFDTQPIIEYYSR